MDDTQRILQTLIDALLRELGAEVDLIFQYGSRIRGNTHPYSDVDISYVPVHETTWKSITVMVADRLYDLYPMHWSRLESMADFRNPSASVLLQNRIVYRRTEEVAARFQALAGRLRGLLQPEAQPEMLRRAMEIFQSTGYEYYMLQVQSQAGSRLACMRHAHSILQTLLHCLAVCNQACIDTRKLEQVLALPRLPSGFEGDVRRALAAVKPGELLAATERLLGTTRDLLLAEQRRTLCQDLDFPAEFESGYPELKRDLQGILLACERQDLFSLQDSLLSLLREMSLGVARVRTGVEYSGFNSLAEYEEDLAALGFPALLPSMIAGDFQELHRQCLVFDEHLRKFLTERSVPLNTFDGLEDLQSYLHER